MLRKVRIDHLRTTGPEHHKTGRAASAALVHRCTVVGDAPAIFGLSDVESTAKATAAMAVGFSRGVGFFWLDSRADTSEAKL